VIAAIGEQIQLAPLHNPANIIGIEVARARMPDVPQVAVFDTAFHQTIPPRAYHYALPLDLHREHHLRRYGFHGTSHRYVAGRAAEYLERPLDSINLITLHLGNGASATAIQAGRSVDTSMGLTPLEGLVMGTRGGDLDPAIPFFIARATGRSADQVETLLNTESGLKGICGVNDMRTIARRAADGDQRSQLAMEMYTYRIRKYIGAYSAVLGHVDAIVFTAGIGENSAEIRAGSCRGLSALRIEIDPVRNASAAREAREIQAQGSAVKVLVIPTNEELEIARETLAAIRARR
jgi:acetate kinase